MLVVTVSQNTVLPNGLNIQMTRGRDTTVTKPCEIFNRWGFPNCLQICRISEMECRVVQYPLSVRVTCVLDRAGVSRFTRIMWWIRICPRV